MKESTPVLCEEGHWRELGPYDRPTIPLERSGAGGRLLVLVNKDWHSPQLIELEGLPAPEGGKLIRIAPDGIIQEYILPHAVTLDPAEIALVLG